MDTKNFSAKLFRSKTYLQFARAWEFTLRVFRKLILAGVFAFFSIAEVSVAAEKFEFFTGVRQNGMGGAAIAVVNDETAIFSNPAALGKLRDPFFTIIDPEITLGTDTGNFVKNFSLDVIGVDNILEKIDAAVTGKRLHLKMQAFPSIVVPNFGIGLLVKNEVNGRINETTDEIELDYVNDYTIGLGYNLRIWDGRIKFGFAGRYILRSQIKAEDGIARSNINQDADDLAANGGAMALDAGLILTMPVKLLPTLSAVVRDVGNTKFNLSPGIAPGTGVDPGTVDQTIDVALAIYPIFTNRTRTAFTLEMRDILSEDQDDIDDIYRRLHFGAEINFNDIFFLRGGMNGRYWTAGAEMAVKNLQFQGATYGEEVGTATARVEDRRYVGKFSYRF